MKKSSISRVVLAGGAAGYGQLAGEGPPGVRETFEAAEEGGRFAEASAQPWRVASGAARENL